MFSEPCFVTTGLAYVFFLEVGPGFLFLRLFWDIILLLPKLTVLPVLR